MINIQRTFKQSVATITDYYMVLVEETKSQRLVGSTNEWVLDNYYVISEQEKVLKIDLKGIAQGKWSIDKRRTQELWNLLQGFIRRCHHNVDKNLLFRYLSQVQVKQKDYLSYPEVFALLPLIKTILISELASLCIELRSSNAFHYSPTDKGQADATKINEAARQNLMMMNIFNSLKKMTKLPVSELVDSVSFSERMLKEENNGMYDQMYDKTKDDYRAQIVRLSHKRKIKEFDLVKELVAKANEENSHVGWQLFPPKRWNARAHWYIWIVVFISLLLAGLFAAATTGFRFNNWQFPILTLLLWVPMSQVVIDLFNQLLYRIHKPVNTFKIKFKDGLIPKEYATMVIMPTILKNKAKTIELLNQLEVYYLSNINRASDGQRLESRPQNLYYTLIGDAASYSDADAPWDNEVVEAGLSKVKELNEKYGAPIFNFVYRRRAWSEGEQTWLGHERKRGAILHFNDLVLGQTTEREREKRFRCETISQWREGAVPDIQFIITLDTDTELVLYSAQKLIGAMAHPLNRAKLSPDGRRVDSGYGIMQPRVNVDVEVTNKSRYAQLFAGLGGLDVYTTASFELYQDIFNEGSFCGKGIYDLKVFQKVLKGTFPENLILSHDLIEGCHIRCGLINDLELFDDNPSNYIDDAKRHHRWTRGDWQIIGWLKNKVRNEIGQKVKNQVNTIGRWKIFDNLRRSVLSLAVVVMILAGYVNGIGNGIANMQISPAWFILAAFIVVASPIVFFILGQVTKMPSFGKRYHYYATLLRGFKVIIYRSIVQFALLPKEAWMYTDALIRACYRMWFSHRDLLAWITSDEAAKSTKGTLGDYLGKFWFNYVCSLVLALLTYSMIDNRSMLETADIMAIIAAALTCVAWCGAPFLMFWLGKKFPQDKKLNEQETAEIGKLAKDTWNFFDTLIVEENNWLIPDNYQRNRERKADYKTSPTNIGYSLTAIVSAAELDFITQRDALKRLQHTIDTVVSLEKWNGHLFNWYDIHTLKALPNFFISTADSGNFVACLYVVKGFLSSIDDKELEAAAGNLMAKVNRLIDQTNFNKLYNSELDVFSIGYDYGNHSLLPYHYNNFASEARLTSFLAIAQGDAPYKHWFCLDKTLVQYKGYKGVASWYGTMFEYFMPFVFLPTYKHTLMDETYSFAIRAQKAFIKKECPEMPWGISETAYNELDDAQNYKYHAFGVPYLKFQNTTPDRIVISPYSSLLAIGYDDRSAYDNLKRFEAIGMYTKPVEADSESGEPEMPSFGLLESYDNEDHVPVLAHYAHHQGMILASLANYLKDNCLQHYFMLEPTMLSMETLLKEKAQVKPYIDLKVTQYKRYKYSKVQTESDAREYDSLATVPEIGVVSNGQYTVLVNDRGCGFSRYRNILINRYRKISADYYGSFLFVRKMSSDQLWSATYAPLNVKPDLYRVSFASDKIRFLRVDKGIETRTDITVIKDHFAEIRRYTFTNNTNTDVDLEITSYSEVILAPKAEDENHRVFNSMKIASEWDAERQALFFTRPATAGTTHFVYHKLWTSAQTQQSEPTKWANLVEYETSRLKFLGRGGSLTHADIIQNRRTLSGTVGTTLDPVMSIRRRLHIPAGGHAEAFAITAFAKSRENLFKLNDQYQTSTDIDYAFKTASVFNNMRNSLSLLKGSQMRLYNSISKYIAQTATLGNHRQAWLAKNKLSQSGLWRYGISGDFAIVLVEIDSMAHSGFAKEMLRAFEYYKVHGLVLDLVFINDIDTKQDKGSDGMSEHDSLNHFIRNMANTEHLWQSHLDAGKVFILEGKEITEDERTLLHCVARLDFDTRDGLTIQQQLDRLEAINQHYQNMVDYPMPKRSERFIDWDDPWSMYNDPNFRVWSNLDYYNQYGGFDNQGHDYVVTNTNTPMPWINVITNNGATKESNGVNIGGVFGCIVSSTMAGFTFYNNAQQFKLTAWSNDIVRDNASEMLLIDGHIFIPATARHSQGWSAFDADSDDLIIKVRLFVASQSPEKYYQIRIENRTDKPRKVKLDMVYKLVLGVSEEQTARYLFSEWNADDNTLKVRNVYHPIYSDKVMMLTATKPITNLSLDSPNRKQMGIELDLPANGENEAAFILAMETEGREKPCCNTTITDIDNEFDRVVAFWDEKLTAIQVETPDRSLNYMLNRWYLYQVYASRLYARTGFYQVGGATGFRDQLQDVMSILYSDPAYARRQILLHAAHQFAEGDVLHWWHSSLRMGARTTFSDDYLWLVYVTSQYVTVTGDTAILFEKVPFCQADQLAPGEAERGMNYATPSWYPGLPKPNGEEVAADPNFEYATLYEHLKRAVNRSMSRLGVHGLPLMGCGDWNDGMSRVGVEGKGESVWVAFFLADLLPKMEQLTQHMAHHHPESTDLSYCEELSSFRQRLVKSIQSSAWDGAWFLRAYYDNGDPMGSRNNTECQIDLISQAWSILTDVATPEQKESVMRETDKRLVNRAHEIIQLLTPPFQGGKESHATKHDPGYIANYPVGVRENGGQYTHGAMWYIMAQIKEGRNDMAYFLYSLINPIHRTKSLADVLKYKVEPYCIAADIYSNPQHPGRGGWTWYTGSASWAYKTGIENILGLHKVGNRLVVDPHVPSKWPGFTIHYRFGKSHYTIHYKQGAKPTAIDLVDDGQHHETTIE